MRAPHTLTERDVEALLAAPSGDDPITVRDRAMLEVLYATGLRVSELVNLTLSDINLRQGVIRVLGKGRKSVLCPWENWPSKKYNFTCIVQEIYSFIAHLMCFFLLSVVNS